MNKIKLSVDLLLSRNDFDKKSTQYQLLNNAGYEINSADTEITLLKEKNQQLEIDKQILNQQIRDLKNRLFEKDIISPRDQIKKNDLLTDLEIEDLKETKGTEFAREIRVVCNKLSDKERENLIKKIKEIYKNKND